MRSATISGLRQRVTEILKGRDINNPETEAVYILEHFCGLTRFELFLNNDKLVSSSTVADVLKASEQRFMGVPLQIILGHTDFRDLRIKVNPGVFIPRPETEILVEVASDLLNKSVDEVENQDETWIMDLGTGTGVIAISLKKMFAKYRIFASDSSSKAIKLAYENMLLNDVRGIEWKCGDLFTPFSSDQYFRKFFMVVSNPPYIPRKDIDTLELEVREHDPLKALSGGRDGLFFFRRILKSLPLVLMSGGNLVMEMGHDQGARLKEMMSDQFDDVKIFSDLASRERIIAGTGFKV